VRVVVGDPRHDHALRECTMDRAEEIRGSGQLEDAKKIAGIDVA
jgi:hypothetical protein